MLVFVFGKDGEGIGFLFAALPVQLIILGFLLSYYYYLDFYIADGGRDGGGNGLGRQGMGREGDIHALRCSG